MGWAVAFIDVNILSPGVDYRDLRRSVVIFICSYDPFGQGRYVYVFENRCVDDLRLPFGDESLKVIANTKGETGDASEGLKALLHYLDAAVPTDDYTRQLDGAVAYTKASEERRHEYMVGMIHDMEIRAEGFEQGIEQGIEQGKASTLVSLVRKGLLSEQAASAEAGVPFAELELIAAGGEGEGREWSA